MVFLFTILLKELDTNLRKCKDEFKEFERQDMKHREDLKHVKQKIKKMDEKVEKVTYTSSLIAWN